MFALHSFEELNDARVAFFCYEEHDMVGMLVDEASLLKALKARRASNYAIPPRLSRVILLDV